MQKRKHQTTQTVPFLSAIDGKNHGEHQKTTLLNTDNLVEKFIASGENWQHIDSYVKHVLRTKRTKQKRTLRPRGFESIRAEPNNVILMRMRFRGKIHDRWCEGILCLFDLHDVQKCIYVVFQRSRIFYNIFL